MIVSFLADVVLVTISILIVLFILGSVFEDIWAEFVETRRRSSELLPYVERLRGRRIRKATARKLVSAGLQPGVVVFATHSMGEELRKRDVFIIRVPEDFGQCPFSKGMRFYRGKLEHLSV